MVALREVAERIYVLRQPLPDVNATLIVGDEVAVVVDTLATEAQAVMLRDAIRAVTTLPLAIINTHGHFDHCAGNGVLAEASPGTGVWAHQATTQLLRNHGGRLPEQWRKELLPVDAALAEEVGATALRPPDRPVHSLSTMDIGGRRVELRHFGRGHTDGDLVVLVPDARVVVTGDLIEQGALPSFTDAYPLDWPETLAVLREHTSPQTVVVPGHGEIVDDGFIASRHEEFTALAWLIRDGDADGAPSDMVAAKAALPAETALVAVRRGYAQLAGQI